MNSPFGRPGTKCLASRLVASPGLQPVSFKNQQKCFRFSWMFAKTWSSCSGVYTSARGGGGTIVTSLAGLQVIPHRLTPYAKADRKRPRCAKRVRSAHFSLSSHSRIISGAILSGSVAIPIRAIKDSSVYLAASKVFAARSAFRRNRCCRQISEKGWACRSSRVRLRESSRSARRACSSFSRPRIFAPCSSRNGCFLLSIDVYQALSHVR
jgi:hypothetical protein